MGLPCTSTVSLGEAVVDEAGAVVPASLAIQRHTALTTLKRSTSGSIET